MNSEQTNEIAAALAKAQGAMENAKFNKVNPHFRSHYADLAAIIDAIKKPLSDNGISYTQTTIAGETSLVLVTRLSHSSGQWLDSEYPLPLAPDKPQVMGSAMTYARRYELAAICGIAAEEDHDGEGVAEGLGARKPPKPKPDVIQGVEGLHGPHVNVPAQHALTGEIEVTYQTDPLPAGTKMGEVAGGIDVQDMAREAAQRGREVLTQFYKSRNAAEKKSIMAIKPELDMLVDAATASYEGEGS